MKDGAPSIGVTNNFHASEHVNSYRAGYLDAMNSVDHAIQLYVMTLRTLGWKDQDILKALVTAIHSYSTGKGLEQTTKDILNKYTGKETYGKQSKTSKL